MPQINVHLNPMAVNMIFGDNFDKLAEHLTKAVETAFGIQGKNDVAVDFFALLHTVREAPVQIDVHYTAGHDEYNTGSVFDPDDKTKETLIDGILAAFADFLKKEGIGTLTPSVWVRPQYQSKFRPGVPEN